MREKRGFGGEKVRERDRLENPHVDVRIIIKMKLKEVRWEHGLV
jgi:hypothetical protein